MSDKKIHSSDFQVMIEDHPENNNSNQFSSLEVGKQQDVAISINNEEKETFEEMLHMQMRLGFIRKVYGILTIQLLITVICCAATFDDSLKLFLVRNEGLFWIVAILSFFLIIPIICFKSISRKVPLNYILLFTWTMCEAYMVACACAAFEPKVVILAALCTLVVTVSITIYAWTTKTDFTFLGGFLFTWIGLIICLGVFSIFFPFLNVVICIGGALLFSLYLLYDTQLIFGKVGLEYSIDDYIIAALNIYLDIIQIFLYLLQIIARLSNN